MQKIGIIEVPTLKDLFIEEIEDQILTGKLKIGEKLPSERSLTEETKISKTVIHAALTELEQKGFLETFPRKGVFVANYLENGTMATLKAIVKRNSGEMTYEQAVSFLEARKLIEGTAMKLLAGNHTEENLKRLRELLAAAETLASEKQPDVAELAKTLFVYHRTICYLSGNEFFPLLLNEFGPIILRFWEHSIEMFGALQNVELAGRYLKDIEQGNGEGAAVRLNQSCEAYLSCLKDS